MPALRLHCLVRCGCTLSLTTQTLTTPVPPLLQPSIAAAQPPPGTRGACRHETFLPRICTALGPVRPRPCMRTGANKRQSASCSRRMQCPRAPVCSQQSKHPAATHPCPAAAAASCVLRKGHSLDQQRTKGPVDGRHLCTARQRPVSSAHVGDWPRCVTPAACLHQWCNASPPDLVRTARPA